MSDVKRIQSLYFSPTGNTKKIIQSVAKGIGLPTAEPIDLTLPKKRDSWSGHLEGDMLLVGIPVYGSTYPSIMLPILNKLKGEGKLAVPIAVCGNCKMGSALAEVCGILKKQGFNIPAAGNFVSEHTCATDEYTIGTGRPDARDLEKAYEFGRKIAEKISSNLADITSVYGGQLHIQCYLAGSLEAPGYDVYKNNGAWTKEIRVKTTRVNLDQCLSCSACAEACPMGAIDSKTLEINDLLCIRCFECTHVCPKGFLHKQVIPPPELDTFWKIQGKRRGEPVVFI